MVPATAIRVLLAAVLPCAGFYLPGVAPIEYEKGHKVDLKVNKLTSTKTQLPYEWYATTLRPRPSKLRGRRACAVCRYSLPFCKPEEVVNQAENLGEVCPARRPSAAVPRQGGCGDTLSDACAGDARRPRDELGLRDQDAHRGVVQGAPRPMP